MHLCIKTYTVLCVEMYCVLRHTLYSVLSCYVLMYCVYIMQDDDWGEVAVKTARELCLHHSNQCLNLLQRFPINKATQELKNFIPILGNNCT